MKVSLSFTTNHTIEEITNYVNRYIIEHRDKIEMDSTEGVHPIIKYTMIRDDSLWD